MKFEEACNTFGVERTGRQRRKWNAGNGRAKVLADALGSAYSKWAEDDKARKDRNRRREARIAELKDAAEAVAEEHGDDSKQHKAVLDAIATIRAEMEPATPSPAEPDNVKACLDRLSMAPV